MKFERWVSLGNFCLTKYQINRYVARNFFNYPNNSTLETESFIKKQPRQDVRAINGGNLFFDWVVTVDYGKVTELFASGFDYELRQETLAAKLSESGKIGKIICKRAGIEWEHLFSRKNDLVDWREQVPELAPKVAHLVSEFKLLRKYKTLYILTNSVEFAMGGRLEKLVTALTALRGAGAEDFRILCCIKSENLPPNTDKVFFRTYRAEPDFPKYPWLGNAESWDRAFADFSLMPSN